MNQSDARVLAIIPAFNEGRCIRSVVHSIRAAAPTWDIAVVDDGSADDTATEAHAAGAIVLRLPINLGIGGAVQTGLMYAQRYDYDAALQIDGDGQHDPSESRRLLDHLLAGDADAVIGSRFLGSDGYQSSAVRRLGIRTLRLIISTLAGKRITDPTSGQRVLGRRAIELLSRDYPQQYPEPETVYVMLRAGLRLEELAVSMKSRAAGQSSIRPMHSVLYMLKVTIALLTHATTRRKVSS